MATDHAFPRRRVDAERNRARLLEAARATFAAEGEAARLEHIARAAGVGIGTLYRNFPTRESLVEAVYRSELAELCASAHELARELDPDLALRAWMDRFAGYVAAKREIAQALAPVYASGAVTVPQIREQLADAVAEILEAGAADGSLRGDARAPDLVAMIVGCFTATRLAGGPEQLDRMFDLLIDAVRRPAG